jgi:hypothetical protein
VKVKKWAKKARTVVVYLEGAKNADARGIHAVEIRSGRRDVLRRRTVEYRDGTPALSTIMTDVQASLARSGLVIDPDSYQFGRNGRVLHATVSVSGKARKEAS